MNDHHKIIILIPSGDRIYGAMWDPTQYTIRGYISVQRYRDMWNHIYFKYPVQSTHRKMSHRMPLNQCVSSSLCSVGIDEYLSQLQYHSAIWHVLWFMYLRWISNFQPLSKPESGIKGCSPRQDKYLPLSSIVGVNLSVDVVVLRSELVCKHNKKQICITRKRKF